MSEPETPPKDPPVTVSKAEFDKLEGQYKALQKKINKAEVLTNTELQAERDKYKKEYDDLNTKYETETKTTLLDTIRLKNKKLATEMKDDSIQELKTALKVLNADSGIPDRDQKTQDDKNKYAAGYRNLSETEYKI